MLSRVLFKIAALAGLAHAHFVLEWPTSRGFDEDIEPEFCGGFNQTNATRTLFPIGDGLIQIDSEHPDAVVGAVISFDQNPTNFSQFNVTSNGTSIPMLFNFTQLGGNGFYCLDTNPSLLNFSEIANGTNATIQLIFSGGDGTLYQCADITFSTNATVPSNITCPASNTVNSSTTETSAGAAPGGATNAASPSSSSAETTSVSSKHIAVGVFALGTLLAVL